MTEEFDNIDFLNTIHNRLEKFIMETFEDVFDTKVWVVFDFEDVKNILQDERAEVRPVFHLAQNDSSQKAIEAVGEDTEGQINLFDYDIYTVINDEIDDNYNRRYVLSRYTSYLKHIFDNERDKLDRIKIQDINYSDGQLSSSHDYLYAAKQRLRFRATKVFDC